MSGRELAVACLISRHDVGPRRYGGSPGILRERGLLEAALYRPQTGYYADLIEEAATLWESLSQNHAFVDGYKRVAFAVTYTFLAINGVRILPDAEQTLSFFDELHQAGTFEFARLVAWLRKCTDFNDAQHPRLRAARDLGRPVRAVVRVLSDADLILAQGEENAARTNLSFIEKSLFALRIDALHGRQLAGEALCVHKTTISQMITIASGLPTTLIEGIGAAPSVGRPRWQALYDVYAQRALTPGFDAALQAFVQSPGMPEDSDDRFDAVVAFIEQNSKTTPGRASAASERQYWTAPTGAQIATIRSGREKFTLSIKQQLAPGFGDFLLTQLDRLYADFSKTQEAPTDET